jgi:hypothetical protein
VDTLSLHDALPISLSVISGRIAKQSPEAMTVRTPSTILGIRGTEFVVSTQ